MNRLNLQAVVLWVLLASINIACKPGISPQIPEAATANAQAAPWLSQMIQEMEQGKPSNPPAKVYRYTYNDQQVYYVTGRCCDIPSKLYDMNGNVICEPDGGITGKGDGRCPDFFEKRSDETLIWEDKREQK
ncbi:DUF6970 domain-containing protein [Pontibacter cellulosilyticus]|uniref:DUF6970 domain-containing protein n=1 Tax=Pontibacter cellulosilyticus TaxID=1720253 RepID=A0A923N9E3_9BACT|nr:hypothetical protein [Pontibacter cellulosilyticus]MBC5994124.1 hypothetical protein [Pontibacter cellulosilyticus]